MNIKTLAKFLFVTMMMIVMVSCNEEPNGNGNFTVPQSVMSNFTEMYPNAKNVKWEQKGKYTVAHFTLQQTRAAENSYTAWFLNENGSWGMTETEMLFAGLPEAVKMAFNASEYAQAPWVVDDEVEQLTRMGDNETIFVIEVEKKVGGIETEMDLYYTMSGVLAKTVIDAEADDDFEDMIPVELPEGVTSWLSVKFPNARIIESDFDHNYYEVELVADGKEMECLFKANGNWILTRTELSVADVPAVVMDALKLTETFVKYHEIEDIEKYETASVGNFYEFELENEFRDVVVCMDESGLEIAKPEIPELKEGLSVSETIGLFLDKKYPNAVIKEKEQKNGYLCIEVEQDGVEKEIRFNGKDEWVDSEWDIDIKDVPVTIMNVLNTAYPNAAIDPEVEFYESAEKSYYEFEIVVNYQEQEVRILTQGVIESI